MRFLKLTLVILLVVALTIATTIVIALFNKNALITYIANHTLAAYNAELNCFDLEIKSDYTLLISKACIETPEAKIDVLDAQLEWQLTNLFEFAWALDKVTVKAMNIESFTDINLPSSAPSDASFIKDLPDDIRKIVRSISAQLDLPVSLDISAFSYRPFYPPQTSIPDIAAITYHGQLSATPHAISFSIAPNFSEGNLATTLLSVNLSPNVNLTETAVLKEDNDFSQGNFSAEINLNLPALKTFLLIHRSMLAESSLAEFFNDEQFNQWQLSGDVNTKINWHQQTFFIANKLRNFRFISDIDQQMLTPFQLDTSLNFTSELIDQVLLVEFDENSQINLQTKQEVLLNYLTKFDASSDVIAMVNANKLNNVGVNLQGKSTIDFAQQNVLISDMNVASNLAKSPITSANFNASFTDISASYQQAPNQEVLVSFNKALANIETSLFVPALNSFTKEAIHIKAVAKIAALNEGWQAELASSSINLTAIKLASVDKNARSKNQLTLAGIHSAITGKIIFSPANSASLPQKNLSITLALTSENQLKKLTIPDVIQLNTLDFNTSIAGDLNKISINSTIVADKVEVAKVTVKGKLLTPQITVKGTDIQATDLLALNIKLPSEVSLIDGKINYHLVGNNIDVTYIANAPFTLDFSIKELTGEIEKTWIQDLNWQQSFAINQGEVSALPLSSVAQTQLNNANQPFNLSIAKIESVIPITEFNAAILPNYHQNGINLIANNIRGNTLDGSFNISQAQWPLVAGHSANVQLTNISLEKLLALDKNQGIVVTGNISGELPVLYDGKYFNIKAGELHNVSNGVIQIYNNPAVEELKSTQTELKIAFNALENLHYHHLSSNVSMGDDGYMLLDTKVKGINPDLGNEVNLNLNLNYDWLGLLESLTITDTFEKKVINKLPKK